MTTKIGRRGGCSKASEVGLGLPRKQEVAENAVDIAVYGTGSESTCWEEPGRSRRAFRSAAVFGFVLERAPRRPRHVEEAGQQSLSILGNTQKAATAEPKNQDGPRLMEMEETRRRDG